MKKVLVICMATIAVVLCASCAKEETPSVSLQEAQMKAICDLSVMKCYFHNVAKSDPETAGTTGILWWKKAKDFWIEYDGTVTLGIDTSRIKFSVDDTNVTITIPDAQVLRCDVNGLTEESFYVDSRSDEVDQEIASQALAMAQEDMMAAAAADTSLLGSAKQRAEDLLTNYVNSIGTATGKNYQITFVDADNRSASIVPAS